ncbi:hypothetical protein BJX68DRAFT_241469 [Aspergillus pseudodeflectus]|uniref:AB hydrolase-1 domain-containing protein n=1 Tax=Aspergillus pseudodeflectus TaxID=176178 RepID=A0ABR4K164_9EURO
MASLDVIHDPGTAADLDIVLVHGLEGDSQSTWTYEPTNLFWPRDLLPKDFPNARILVFSYPARFTYFFPDAGDHDPTTTPGRHTLELRDALTRLRELPESKNRPVIFIAHGLGGLICAQLASVSMWDIEFLIKGIIFLSTPFGDGQDESWEGIIRAYHAFFSATNPRVITADSAAAQSTNAQRIIKNFDAVKGSRDDDDDDFSLRVAFLLPRNATEDRDGNAAMIVEHDYAVPDDYDGTIVPGDQVSMTKFPDGNSIGYKVLCQSIRRWTEGVPKPADWNISHYIRHTGIMNNTGSLYGLISGDIRFPEGGGQKI